MATAVVNMGRISAISGSGGGTNYEVRTPAGVRYLIFVDVGTDVVFIKSTNDGISWTNATTVFAGTVTNLSVSYDKWSGLSTGLIHCAYTESGGHDTLYRTIDTENSDALSTQTTIFAGTSVATGGCLTISRSRGGNVYCYTVIDAGVEAAFVKLLNANVPNGAWEAALLLPDVVLGTTDQAILMPGSAADNNDMILLYWDASADEIDRVLYDDSLNLWSTTNIATAMVDDPSTSTYPNWAATVDLTNSRIIMAAWSRVDFANADLRCWTISESAITEVTNVVLNSTDDQGGCAVGLDTATNAWYVFYSGNSAGTETWATSLRGYYKVSTDAGTTWGAETLMSGSELYPMRWLITAPRFDTKWSATWLEGTAGTFFHVATLPSGGQGHIFGG